MGIASGYLPCRPRTSKQLGDISICFDPQARGKKMTITAYDMAVMDAVYTLHVYHDLQVSDTTILQIMYGKRDLDITPEKVRQLHNSIYKLSQITVCVRCSEAFQVRRIVKKDEWVTYQGNLLPLKSNHNM